MKLEPSNRRLHTRFEVSKNAKVISSNQRQLIDVTITDLSLGGARIQLKSATDLSGEFHLYIPPEKVLHSVSVKWMKGNMVGLQFRGEPEDAAWKSLM